MIDRFEAFVTSITTCYKQIQQIKSAEMTELGLKGTHTMCLFFLGRHDGLTAAELCQYCVEDKAAISRTLATLRDKGFVHSEGNAYRAKWFLTDVGRQAAERLNDAIVQWVERGGAGLTVEERTAFYKSLEHIARNLQESGNA